MPAEWASANIVLHRNHDFPKARDDFTSDSSRTCPCSYLVRKFLKRKIGEPIPNNKKTGQVRPASYFFNADSTI